MYEKEDEKTKNNLRNIVVEETLRSLRINYALKEDNWSTYIAECKNVLRNCGTEFSKEISNKLIQETNEKNMSEDSKDYINLIELHVLANNYEAAVKMSQTVLKQEEYSYSQVSATKIIHFFGNNYDKLIGRQLVRNYIQKVISRHKDVESTPINELSHAVSAYSILSGICNGLLNLVEQAADIGIYNAYNCLELEKSISSHNSNLLTKSTDKITLQSRLNKEEQNKEENDYNPFLAKTSGRYVPVLELWTRLKKRIPELDPVYIYKIMFDGLDPAPVYTLTDKSSTAIAESVGE